MRPPSQWFEKYAQASGFPARRSNDTIREAETKSSFRRSFEKDGNAPAYALPAGGGRSTRWCPGLQEGTRGATEPAGLAAPSASTVPATARTTTRVGRSPPRPTGSGPRPTTR